MDGKIEISDEDYRIKFAFCYGGTPHRWKGGPEIWRCEKCGLGVSGTRIVIDADELEN